MRKTVLLGALAFALAACTRTIIRYVEGDGGSTPVEPGAPPDAGAPLDAPLGDGAAPSAAGTDLAATTGDLLPGWRPPGNIEIAATPCSARSCYNSWPCTLAGYYFTFPPGPGCSVELEMTLPSDAPTGE